MADPPHWSTEPPVPLDATPVDSDRLHARISVLWEERSTLMSRVDIIDKERRRLLMTQSRQDHSCKCVRLNSEIGVFNMSDTEARRRATFGAGFVQELLSADRDCLSCDGTGVPQVSGTDTK